MISEHNYDGYRKDDNHTNQLMYSDYNADNPTRTWERR